MSWGAIWLAGFVLVWLYGMWMALRPRRTKRTRWPEDLLDSGGITIFALVWPITIAAGFVIGRLIMRADKGKLG